MLLRSHTDVTLLLKYFFNKKVLISWFWTPLSIGYVLGSSNAALNLLTSVWPVATTTTTTALHACN